MVESTKPRVSEIKYSDIEGEDDPKALAAMVANIEAQIMSEDTSNAAAAKIIADMKALLGDAPKQHEEAWVKWNFDGQVRHRLHD